MTQTPSRIVAVVPARGGSKGLPGKNLRPLGGKPMIGWSIEAALEAHTIDEVVVSTDDPRIARVAEQLGATVPGLRPAGLAADDTPTMDVLRSLLPELGDPRAIVLLQPTSPLRTAADIDDAVALWNRTGTAVVSVTEADPPPAHMLRVLDGEVCWLPGFSADARPRQALAPTWALNGAIYIASPGWLQRHRTFIRPDTRLFAMPKARSVDIDDAEDLWVAEAFLEHRARARPVRAA